MTSTTICQPLSLIYNPICVSNQGISLPTSTLSTLGSRSSINSSSTSNTTSISSSTSSSSSSSTTLNQPNIYYPVFSSNIVPTEECARSNNTSLPSNTYNTSSAYSSSQSIINSSVITQPTTSSTLPPSTVLQSIFYTDGSFQASTSKKPSAAGWSFIQLTTLHNQELHCLVESYGPTPSTFPDKPTNNSSELTAIYEVLLYLRHQSVTTVVIRTDSTYSIKVITKQYRSQKNRTLLSQIHSLQDQLSSRINITFEHVRAHVGDTWNERADILAKQGAHTPMRIRQVFPRPTSPLSTIPLTPPVAHEDFQNIQDFHPDLLVPPVILPPSDPLQDLPDHIALFSTQVPITLYHVYEWYTGSRQIPEKEKLSKTNFDKLSTPLQLQELSHLGLHISTLHQAYNLVLHGFPILKKSITPMFHPIQCIMHYPR